MAKKNNRIIIIIIVVLLLLAGVFWAIQYYARSIFIEKLTENINRIEANSSITIEYKQADLAILSREFFISDIRITDNNAQEFEQISIAKLAVGGLDYRLLQLLRQDNSLDSYGLSIQLNEVNVSSLIDKQINKFNTTTKQKIKELDLNLEFIANVTIDYEYFLKKQELHIQQLTASIRNLADINLKLLVNNLASNQLSQTLAKAELSSMKIAYTDLSLLDTIINKMAKQDNMGKEEALAKIHRMLERTFDNDGVYNGSVRAEVTKFLRNPKKLSISLSTKQAVPIANILNSNDRNFALKKLNPQVKYQ